jgi:hypothetical protein
LRREGFQCRPLRPLLAPPIKFGLHFDLMVANVGADLARDTAKLLSASALTAGV